MDVVLDFIVPELAPDFLEVIYKKMAENRALRNKIDADFDGLLAMALRLTEIAQNENVPLPAKSETMELSKDYNVEWTWQDKIKFALDQLKKASTGREIVEYLGNYEPAFLTIGNKKAIGSVSAILSTKSGKENERKPFIRNFRQNGDIEFINNPRGEFETIIFMQNGVEVERRITIDEATNLPFQ